MVIAVAVAFAVIVLEQVEPGFADPAVTRLEQRLVVIAAPSSNVLLYTTGSPAAIASS